MKQVYFLIFLFLGLSIKAQYKSICDDSKLWQSEFVYQDVQNMESEWRYHEGFLKEIPPSTTLPSTSILRDMMGQMNFWWPMPMRMWLHKGFISLT